MTKDNLNLNIQENSYLDLLKTLDLQNLDSDLIEEKLTNSILRELGAPVSKKDSEYRLGDEDGLSFYINPKNDSLGFRYAKKFSNGGDIERYRIEPTPPQLGGLGLNLKERVLNYLDQPLNTEDPIQNLASGVAEFIPGLSQELARRRGDKLGEYLGYLDYLPGGGIPAEAISIIAKRRKLMNDLRRERDIQARSVDPNELDASSRAEARIIKQLRNIIDETKTHPRSKIEPTMPPDPAPFKNKIYHGGPSGIETLRTPKFIQDDMYNLNKSTGGIYSVLDKNDPRLKLFGYAPPTRREDMLENLTPALRQQLIKDLPKKSVYKISPEFKNIADAENLPPDFIEELIKIRDNINVFKGNPYDQALNQNTRNTLELMTQSPKVGAPSMINKPVGDIFRGAGYDSILFPPRKLMRDESKTILSLDDDLIQNFEEFNLADLLNLRD